MPMEIRNGNGWGASSPGSAMEINGVSGIEKFSKCADAFGEFCC